MVSNSSTRVASDGHRMHTAATRDSLWVSVDSVTLPTATTSIRPAGDERRRTTVQCVVIASLASFVVGLVMTAASFGPVLYSPVRSSSVVVLILQVTHFLLIAFFRDITSQDKNAYEAHLTIVVLTRECIC